MTPDFACIFSKLTRRVNTDAECRRLPSPLSPRTAAKRLIWPFSLAFWTLSSRRLLLSAGPSNASCRRRRWLRPQFRDQPQSLLEHLPWDGDLGHLKGDIAAVAPHLRVDLDRPIAEKARCFLRCKMTWMALSDRPYFDGQASLSGKSGSAQTKACSRRRPSRLAAIPSAPMKIAPTSRTAWTSLPILSHLPQRLQARSYPLPRTAFTGSKSSARLTENQPR